MKKSLLVVSLCLGCNSISGINEYEVASQEPVAATKSDGAADDAARPEVFGEETQVDAGLDAAAETGIVDVIDTGVVADAVADSLMEADVVADDGPCTPISHSNGLGQTYLDCAPLGTPGVASTYTVTMAAKARAAWPFAGVDEAWACSGGSPDCLLRRATGKGCAVWSYASIYAGRVDFRSSGECGCSSSAPTWD